MTYSRPYNFQVSLTTRSKSVWDNIIHSFSCLVFWEKTLKIDNVLESQGQTPSGIIPSYLSHPINPILFIPSNLSRFLVSSASWGGLLWSILWLLNDSINNYGNLIYDSSVVRGLLISKALSPNNWVNSTGLLKSILRFKTRIIKGILFDLLFDHAFNFRCLGSNYCEKIFSEKFELLGIPKMSERVLVTHERYVSTDESRVNIDGENNGQVKFDCPFSRHQKFK